MSGQDSRIVSVSFLNLWSCCLSELTGLANHRKKITPTEEDFEALSVAAEFLNPTTQRVMVDRLDQKRRQTLPKPKDPQRFHKELRLQSSRDQVDFVSLVSVGQSDCQFSHPFVV